MRLGPEARRIYEHMLQHMQKDGLPPLAYFIVHIIDTTLPSTYVFSFFAREARH